MSGKRSIFEETGAAKGDAPVVRVDVEGERAAARRGIALWLTVLAALVVAMVLLGGLTRLTDSGLSMTEWKPVTGAMPPSGEAAWQAEFELYKASPEFREQNSGMDLGAFKRIYWWEWSHRQLGRLIGLVWAAGFVWFLVRRQMPVGWTGRLAGIGGMIGLQGLAGWWMVSSGLTGRMVDVASYRLALHLGLAFAILGLLVWYVLSLRRSEAALLQARRQRQGGLVVWASVVLALVFVQVLLGALVAGIDAGRNYPTWPDMGGEFLPSESFGLSPWWSNFTEDPALVQFNHRMLAYGIVLVAGWVWWRSRGSALTGVRQRFGWMAAAVLVQVALGILTVLSAAAPHWAIVHQAMAMAVFVAVLGARFEALYPRAQSLRG